MRIQMVDIGYLRRQSGNMLVGQEQLQRIHLEIALLGVMQIMVVQVQRQ